MATKGKPDITIAEHEVKMWERHCRQAFVDIKEQLRDIAKSQAENMEVSRHERKANAEHIAALHAIVTNGLSHRVDRMDRRLWIILGVMVTLAGAVIADIVRGGL